MTEFSEVLKVTKILTFKGKVVTLKPLNIEEDCVELYNNCSNKEYEWIWKYLFVGPFKSLNDFKNHLKSIPNDWITYVVIHNKSKLKIGMISYLNIIDKFGTIEIGGIWYIPPYHGTLVNTESSYLLIKHAFEVLKYRRVQWKCDNLNSKSKSAALRLGFKYEGLLRNHFIIKGLNRDTAYFSIIQNEWNMIKSHLQWLLNKKYNKKSKL